MSGQSAGGRRLAVALLLAAVMGSSFAIWLVLERGSAPTAPGSAPQVSAQRVDERIPRRSSKAFAGSMGQDAGAIAQASACAPRTERRCDSGDVFWVDGCGQLGERAEDCGPRLCREGACEQADPEACSGWPLEGVCDGEVVRGCLSGRAYARDCAALGKRCVTTDEGASCRRPSPDDCERHGVLPRCEGTELLGCIDGLLVRTDCGARGALCGKLPGAAKPSCHVIERRARPPRDSDACGACGCPPTTAAGATDGCNGLDDDGDDRIDEDAACEPIPILAFVVTDSIGRGSYARADIEQELERVNKVLATAPAGLALTATLVDVVYLERPAWLDLDDEGFEALVRDPEVVAARDSFYVPVVFTDTLLSGDAPKAGVSTLPNGHCGGRRINPGPEPLPGAIAVAKGRAPTTVAHELGHFFGLCHTHFAYDQAVVRVVRWPVSETEAAQLQCGRPCVLDGDGICDTPPDPGPPVCGYDDACRVMCPDAAAPDAFNIMSYYTECRRDLSALQALTFRRGLSLRRGFFACRTPTLCPCDPHAPVCPEQMTCRPTPAGFGCGLDGPKLPGQACAHQLECSGGAVCASDGRCRLPCGVGDPQAGCRCTRDARLGIAVCGE